MQAPQKTLADKVKRFLAVGLFNTAVDFSVFSLCLFAEFAPLAANGIAWLIAVLISYGLNARWSFDRSRSHLAALPRFMAAGALISLVVSSGFVGLIAPLTGLWPAKIAGTIAAAALNFVAARWSIENRIS